MARAILLAKKGKGNVSPNPMVGCVIVHNNKIIGEGFTSPYGGPHAEVNAVQSVNDQDLLKASTMYVTLEPCAHFGKTPPCADLIIDKKIPKVVVATSDPFIEVDGKGIEKLRNEGVNVNLGVLEEQALFQNRRFFTFHKKKRPYVILKWAQTSDEFIARPNGDSKWISNSSSRQLVHQWRSEEDAILVGKNTALNDNPSLTVRDWTGKNPTRILLDSELEVGITRALFDSAAETIIFNRIKESIEGSIHYIKVESMDIPKILSHLHELKIQSLIAEGGTQVLNSFIQNNCWDEARVFKSPTSFEDGIKAPKLVGELSQTEQVDSDILNYFMNKNG